MNNEQNAESAKGFVTKVKAAFKYNPYAAKREAPIYCPKCHHENLAIAVSCKECGEIFAYKPVKSGVAKGLGLFGGIFFLIASWIIWGFTGSSVAGFLWCFSVAAIVGAVAMARMKHWGWKVVSVSCIAWILLFMTDNSGPVIGLIGGAILTSPLWVAAWLGYKSMVEAGKYLDDLHKKPESVSEPAGPQAK